MLRLIIIVAVGAAGIFPPLTLTEHSVIHQCERYRYLVNYYRDEFFPELGTDLVLAVMAQESNCVPDMDDGVSVGLMAVTPQAWTTTKERLLIPRINILYGMWILNGNLFDREHNPTHSIRIALGAYNCGWVSLEAGRCYRYGGYVYADRVLEFWLPKILVHNNS